MAVKYVPAPDVQELVERIAECLGWRHLRGKVSCVRAQGSAARWTIARVHALPRVFQPVLGISPRYVIEVIPAVFDPMPEARKIETLIHELLHIPKACGGGLRSHRFVTRRRVKSLSKRCLEAMAGGGRKQRTR